MSTSQRAPMRRIRRPPQTVAAEARLQTDTEQDSSLPCRSPALDVEERFDSVLLSSRSTTSLCRGQTSSTTARASANNDAPLSHSPQLATRGSNSGGGSAGVRLPPADSSSRAQRGDLADVVDKVLSASQRDSQLAVRATPEKLVAKLPLDGASCSPNSQIRTSSEGRAEDTQLRPVEDSLSFEFYSTHHPSQKTVAAGKASSSSSGGTAAAAPTAQTAAAAAAPVADVRILRGIVGNPYRESPMAPSALPRMAMPDGLGQRYIASLSSRDQQRGGRYEAMSQSSRFEDAHQLSPRPADGSELFTIDGARHRMPLLDDMVLHSTTESFSVDDASAQPPRVDASMNSQNFVRNYKRRHTTTAASGRANGPSNITTTTTTTTNTFANGAGGNGGGAAGALNARYASVSMTSSPHMSADIMPSSGLLAGSNSGPDVVSSDQLTRMPIVHGGKHSRGGTGAAPPQHHHGNNGVDLSGDRQDGRVLSQQSSDTLILAASHSPCASPRTDDFSMVRAPITGLRAKVLGNAAVDEDEAAEDPEAQKLLAEQLQTFVSKVVRQRQDGCVSLQQGSATPGGAEGTLEKETRADILRRANAAAAAEALTKKEKPCEATATNSSSTADTVVVVVSHSATEEVKPKKGKKANKRVRFNLEGLTPRDEEGPNALTMPRHSTGQKEDQPHPKRPLSPPAVTTPNNRALHVAAGEEQDAQAKRVTSPLVVDVRSVLRAGVAEDSSSAPSSPAMVNAAAGALMTSPTSPEPHRYAVAESSSCVRVMGTDEDDSAAPPLVCTPLTPSAPSSPMAAIGAVPSSLVAPPTNASTTTTTTTAAVPVPPAPTTLAQIAASSPSSHNTPQKKTKAVNKVRKATKMHRKAAVALVAGAGESITVARSSTSSSVPQVSMQPPSAGSVLSSMEVCEPESGPLRASLHSPSLQSSSDTVKPTHRISVATLSQHQQQQQQQHVVEVSPSGSSITSPCAPTTPPPLRALQVVMPRQPSTVPALAPIAKAGGEAPRRPRRDSATSGSRVTSAGTTAPTSRRSSLSVCGHAAPKVGTSTELLPPLSPSSRSRTSTPDVVQPPTSGAAAADLTDNAALTAAEVHVLLPPALARRASVSHDTIGSSNSAVDFPGPGGASGALRKERSCSTMEYKGEREVSPTSTTSDDRSTTREPSAAPNSSRVQVVQVSTNVLPRLSSTSVRPRSTSQTMPPPTS